MVRCKAKAESSQSNPEMVDELTRQEIATWHKDGKRRRAALPAESSPPSRRGGILRESCFSLLTNLKLGRNVNLEEIKRRRDDLQGRLKEVYRYSPMTISKAHAKITQALKECETMTFSDAEIDRFLPQQLQKGALAHGRRPAGSETAPQGS